MIGQAIVAVLALTSFMWGCVLVDVLLGWLGVGDDDE